MLNFGWWKDKDNRDSVSAIVGALKVVVPAGLAVLLAGGAYLGLMPPKSQTEAAPPAISVAGTGKAVQTGDGTQVVQGDNGTVIIGMTIDQHEAILHRRMTELRGDLGRATAAEKQLIQAELADVSGQLADLQSSYQRAVEELRQLRLRLGDFEGRIPPERLAAAQAALYEGDRSLADDLFAELEADLEDEIELAAQAAFGRGKIAEQEIRWADAATHYARAAGLAPDFDRLYKAREFAWRAGDFSAAFRHGEDLLTVAKKGDSQTDLATALNEHALSLSALGQYAEAEALYREALEIDRATIGERHPSYAIHLNNLGGVVRNQGRFAEAEALYRDALEIDRVTIGERHPSYAIHLNNLGLVVRDQGRFAEAEALYRDALEIDRVTIGERHPSYASRLNNLGLVVRDQGRFAEAEALYRDALEIDRVTIGERHPSYASRLNNLGLVVKDQGRFAEAEALFRKALEIDRATIGEGHPYYGIRLNNLALAVEAQGRVEEARGFYHQALEIFEATLPADHPNLGVLRDNIAALPADRQ